MMKLQLSADTCQVLVIIIWLCCGRYSKNGAESSMMTQEIVAYGSGNRIGNTVRSLCV